MQRTEPFSAVEAPESFTDVLYLTDQVSMPAEIKQLLEGRKLSYRILRVDSFCEVRDRIDLIGTVVIDTSSSMASQQQLARIIESLEMQHIGVILLTDPTEVPIRNSSLLPSEFSFSLSSTMEGISVDELWTRMSVNLAYRKGSLDMAVKHAIAPRQVETICKNQLAEQLSMTKSLADNLAEQLRLAGLVQQDFLPTKLPNTDETRWATVFLPAEWVSGDIYDVARIDEQHIGFYVADVVGHGMPAALLTIFIKQALAMRETTGNNYRVFSPAEVVKNLNMRMTAQKLSGYQFATCCYCLLNIKTLRLTYARAGHPYPVIIRLGAQPEQLEVRGSLLGIFEKAEYGQQTVQLQPGDKILLYSDGAEPFIGSFNNLGGFSFNEQFCRTSDSSIIDIVDSFKAAMQNKEIDSSEIDDITLLGLEILPSIAGN